MKKLLVSFLFIILFLFKSISQTNNQSLKQNKPLTQEALVSQNNSDSIAVIEIDNLNSGINNNVNIASLLTASRSPFYGITSYAFYQFRYRFRGYESMNSNSCLNGAALVNLESNTSLESTLIGLNEILYNRESTIGINKSSFAFGGIGTNSNIDTRSVKQKKQTSFGYSGSNTGNINRWFYKHSTGVNSKGWAFVYSGSFHYSKEGYIPGTYSNGVSYYLGIDKRINQKNLISFLTYNSVNETGKGSYQTKEAFELGGSHYYNSVWGYQMGKKRNSAISVNNIPVIQLIHERYVSSKTNIITSVNYLIGERGNTSLNSYHATIPSSVYYANMPSFYLHFGNNDIAMYNVVDNTWRKDESVRQTNWNNLYQSNKGAGDSLMGLIGNRAHYLLGNAITTTYQLGMNSTYNTVIDDKLFIVGGVSYQSEVDEHYMKAEDMLGSDYYVDANQFAEFNFSATKYNQQDSIIRKGGKFLYDYKMMIQNAKGWLQGEYKLNHFDLYLASEYKTSSFYRAGIFSNSLYPNKSKGESVHYTFNGYAVKGGITWKIDGKNYLYTNAYTSSSPPTLSSVFIAPKTRDQSQDNISNETIAGLESGYVVNAPKLRLSIAGYYTESMKGTHLMTYYDDQYANFVNISIKGIDKVFYGVELGVEDKLTNSLTINVASAINRGYYNSRQFATTTVDNVDSILSMDTVYAMNYRIGGTPQEVFSLGSTYRSPHYWFVNISANYYNELWVEMSPVRREYRATTGAVYQSEKWQQIVHQEELPSGYFINLYGGYSWKIPKDWGLKKPAFINFSISINNLFNNLKMIAGGYEQLRYDFKYYDAMAFPNKYRYAIGANYRIAIAIRY